MMEASEIALCFSTTSKMSKSPLNFTFLIAFFVHSNKRYDDLFELVFYFEYLYFYMFTFFVLKIAFSFLKPLAIVVMVVVVAIAFLARFLTHRLDRPRPSSFS